MDDYSLTTLSEGQNEWAARLLLTLTPVVIEGITSIFDEAVKLCEQNEEPDQSLITFQTFLSRVPKWNNDLINTETKRIITSSGCDYLADIISCVHVLNLKALSCIRVGQESKKITIDIPKLEDFIHKVYIAVARKAYTNVYLFEPKSAPLETQKNRRELELMVQECILNVIRESVPVDEILRSYLAQSQENIEAELPSSVTVPSTNDTSKKDLLIPSLVGPAKADCSPTVSNKDFSQIDESIQRPVAGSDIETRQTSVATPTTVSFNNTDSAVNTTGAVEKILAPKDVPRLEAISEERNIQRKKEEAEEAEEAEEEEQDFRLKIGEEVKLDLAAITEAKPDPIVLDIKDV